MGISAAIAGSALQNGIDPGIALRVFKGEGAGGYVGDGGSSFGPFQFHYGGLNPSMPHPGIGDLFTQATGLDARDPATIRQQIDFAMRYVSQNGWGPWMGAAKQGITGFTGVNRSGASAPNSSANLPAANAMSVASAQRDPLAGYGLTDQPTSSSVAPAKEEFAVPPKPASVRDETRDPLAGYEISTAPEVPPPSGPPKPETPAQPVGPAGSPPLPPPSAANAAATGFFNGLPIIGPYAQAGMQRLTAWGQSQATGQPYDQALSDIQGYGQASTTAYPKTALAGHVGGAVAGTLPAMAAFPTAFGLGAGSMVGRMGASALAGGALSGTDAASRGGNAQDIERATALGLVTGGAAPGVGALAGRIVTGAGSALSGVSQGARILADKLAEVGKTPADIAALPPAAVPADLDPALSDMAGRIAARGYAGPTSTLKNAMIERGAGADDRVNAAVTQFVGPRPDLTAAKEAIQTDASTSAAPYYAAARQSAPNMDIQPVLSDIDARLAGKGAGSGAVGATAAVLNKAKSLLTSSTQLPNGKTALIPLDDPQSLISARQNLDAMINWGGPLEMPAKSADKDAIATLKAVRGNLDQVLKTDPNIAAGDSIYASKISASNALQEGTNLFKSETRIEDLQRSIAAKTPDQLDAMRTGALSALHDQLDGVRGDFSAARQLFAKATANRAKLDALFPNSQQMLDNVAGEMGMRATESNIAHGSQTASRQAEDKLLGPPVNPGGTGSVIPALVAEAAGGGGLGTAAAAGGSALFRQTLGAFSDAARQRLNAQLAQRLVMPYAGRPALVNELNRANATGALTRSLGYGGNVIGNAITRNAPSLMPPSVFPSENFPALSFARPALTQ